MSDVKGVAKSDGGNQQNISLQNIKMKEVDGPISLRPQKPKKSPQTNNKPDLIMPPPLLIDSYKVYHHDHPNVLALYPLLYSPQIQASD